MNSISFLNEKLTYSILIFIFSGDIRQFPEDSSSEDASPSEHKNTRSRSHGGERFVFWGLSNGHIWITSLTINPDYYVREMNLTLVISILHLR